MKIIKKHFDGEIKDLETTITNLQETVTQLDEKINYNIEILEGLKMGNSTVPWWKDENVLSEGDHEVRMLAYNIERRERKQIAYDKPSIKKRVIFHGGCLQCETPLEKGVGICTGCQFFTGNWSDPDLSKL